MKDPFPEHLPDPIGKAKKALLWVAYVCLVLSVAGVLAAAARALWSYTRSGPTTQVIALPNPAQEIVDARDSGQYDKALQLAADGLQKYPEITKIRDLSEQMHRDFKPHLDLRCPILGKPLNVGSNEDICETLAPADDVYVNVDLPNNPDLPESQRRYFVYLFFADSNGDWKVLLPNKAYPNPLPPNSYRLPEVTDYKGRLHPSDMPGRETFYLVVAWWRIPALESLAASLAAETDQDSARALGRQIDARIQLERAKPDALQGLKVGRVGFNSSGKH